MRKSIPNIALLILLLLAALPSFAQPSMHIPGYDFHPMQHVIFEDNFNQDSIGKFPSKWDITDIGMHQDEVYKKYIKVTKEGNGNEIVVPDNYQPYLIVKEINNDPLPDSFTIEYDFYLGNNLNTGIDLNFNFQNTDYIKRPIFGINYTGKLWIWDSTTNYFCKDKNYPGHFDNSFWHHFALYYNNRKVKWYIDQLCVFTSPSCGYIPVSFSLQICGLAKMRNYRLATGMPRYEFERLATEKKLVTHAINFDVAKSTVRPESMEFIRQLARYLTDHPTLKLEIDGHTDNDGTTASNEKLSQARAGEVKRQLVLANVSAERLSAKGFGATKPLKPGNSIEDKAENRRVEFIVIR